MAANRPLPAVHAVRGMPWRGGELNTGLAVEALAYETRREAAQPDRARVFTVLRTDLPELGALRWPSDSSGGENGLSVNTWTRLTIRT